MESILYLEHSPQENDGLPLENENEIYGFQKENTPENEQEIEGVEENTPENEQEIGVEENTPENEQEIEDEPLAKKAFITEPLITIEEKDMKSAVPSPKVIQRNRNLRKALLPRNALTALNELKGISIDEVSFDTVNGMQTAEVSVNGTQYLGHGISNMAAKNAACEKALAEFMTYKLKPIPLDGGAGEVTSDPDDDKSILNLASFALHKLFIEWEGKGYPVPKMLVPKNVSRGNADIFARSDLPDGWETMHPVTVLITMRPNINFRDGEAEASGNQDDGVKCVRVTVDECTFSAVGRSKKIARRLVAIDACNTLFDTNFTYADRF